MMEHSYPPLVEGVDHVIKLNNDPEGFLRRCRDQYGAVFTVSVDAGRLVTYILDPHAFGPLLMSRCIDFSPVSRQSKARFNLGQAFSSDEEIRSLSGDILRALNGEPMDEVLQRFDVHFQTATQTLAESLVEETCISIQEIVHRTLVPAVVTGLFGDNLFDDTFVEDFLVYSGAVAKRLVGSEPSLEARGKKAESALLARLKPVLDQSGSSVVEELRRGVFSRPDLSDVERLQTLLMLLWGSMVNLIPTSVWMYASLIRRPKYIEAVRQEVAAGGTALSSSIVSESLRLFSRPNMYRQISEDFDLTISDGRTLRLRAGDWVALFPRLLHHDARVFSDPHSFKAQRFLSSERSSSAGFTLAGCTLKHPLMVFGLGRGRCPGERFASTALSMALHHWVNNLSTRPVEATMPRAVLQTVASTPEPADMAMAWVCANNKGFK